VQRVFCATFSPRAEGRRAVDAVQLKFKLLVYEQQGLHCATHVAAASGNYLINNCFGVVENTGVRGASHGHILG
jgi:hypothetical protein